MSVKNKILVSSIDSEVVKKVKIEGYESVIVVSLEKFQEYFKKPDTIAAVVIHLSGSYSWSLLEYTKMQRSIKNYDFFLIGIVEDIQVFDDTDCPFRNEANEANEPTTEAELAKASNVDSVVCYSSAADLENINILLQSELPLIPDLSPDKHQSPKTIEPNHSVNPTVSRVLANLDAELIRLKHETAALLAEDAASWTQINSVRKIVQQLQEIKIEGK